MTPKQRRVRRTLNAEQLGQVVHRWLRGAPGDKLAAELSMPRDELWNTYLGPALAARGTRPKKRRLRKFPSVVSPTAPAEPSAPIRHRPALAAADDLECIGTSCPYGCSTVCGRTVASTGGTPRVDH